MQNLKSCITSATKRIFMHKTGQQYKSTHISDIFNKYEINIDEELSRSNKHGIPSCLKDDKNFDFYKAIVVHELLTLEKRFQKHILHKFNIDHKCATTIVNDSLSEKILPEISKSLNTNPSFAAILLGKVLKIKPEFCFNSFPLSCADIQKRSKLSKDIADRIPNNLAIFGRDFRKHIIDYQYTANESTSHAICQYVDTEGYYISVFAAYDPELTNSALEIGKFAAPSLLLSNELLILYEKSPVFICPDIQIALLMRQNARYANIEPTQLIISGFLGEKAIIKSLAFGSLSRHPVTIITAPHQRSWEYLKELVQCCEKVGAKNIKIYPWPIFANEDSIDFSIYTEELQKILKEKSQYCSSENIQSLIKDIYVEGIPAGDFPEWEKSRGLNQPQSKHKNAHDKYSVMRKIDNLNVTFSRKKISQVALREMFASHYISLIWGSSNAGKSWVALEIAISLAAGKPCFYWTASSPCNVCYFDGEMGQDLDLRVKQLAQEQQNLNMLINSNLHIIQHNSKLAPRSDETQEIIISELKEKKINILIFDNVLSIIPEAAQNSTTLFNFFAKLIHEKIGVIFIHHSCKDGKEHKGSVDFLSRSQNVIHLEGREQLQKETNKDLNHGDERIFKNLELALETPGPLVRVTIDKCKVAPNLERQAMVYKMPVAGTWEVVNGDMAVAQKHFNKEPEGYDNNQSAIYSSLPDSQQKVYKFFLQNPQKDIKNKDIRSILEVKEGAIRNALRALEQSGHIERIGKDNKTTYRLKTASRNFDDA